MLPDRSVDSWIIWDGFVVPVHILIVNVKRFSWNVVNEGSGVLWDLVLEDECHICLVNLHCISIYAWPR